MSCGCRFRSLWPVRLPSLHVTPPPPPFNLPPPRVSVPPLPPFSFASDDTAPGACCKLVTIGRGDVHTHTMHLHPGCVATLWATIVAKGVTVSAAAEGASVEACVAGVAANV
jgi:hypothetical protein